MKSFFKIEHTFFIVLCCLMTTIVLGQNSMIQGTLYYDVNNNCLQDDGEIGIADQVVTLTSPSLPEPLYALANHLGYYSFEVEGGALYTISVEESDGLYNYWEVACAGNDIPLSVAPGNTSPDINFAFSAILDCAVIEVTSNVGPLIPGQSSQLVINYANIGTAIANDVVIDLFTDPSLSLEESAINILLNYDNNAVQVPTNDTVDVSMEPSGGADAPGFAVINNQISLSSLSPGASGYLTLDVFVNPTAIPNSSACIQVEAYPQEYCGPVNPLWDGSDISVSGICTGDSIQFTVFNLGDDMDDIITIVVYEDIILSFIEDATLREGDSLVITLPGDGSTYTLVTEQSAYYPGYDKPTVSVEACSASGGNISYGYVNDFAQNDKDPFRDVLCSEISAIAPGNLKSVNPSGIGALNYVKPGEVLEYTIYFDNPYQNPGVLTIEDELSPFLDINTLKLGRGSHFSEVSLIENRTIEWFIGYSFDQGEPGYVSFTIEVAADIPPNTQITNQAVLTFGENTPFDSNSSGVVVCEDCVTQQVPRSLQAKVFLEGVYQNNGTMLTTLSNQIPIHQPYSVEPYRYYGDEQMAFSPASQSVVDWVLVEARYGPLAISGQRSSVTIETQAALLYSDGSIRSVDGNLGVTFNNLIAGEDYHFCVRHRNHLDVVTAYAIPPANVMIYDFTNNVNQAFGASQMKIANDGKAMLFGADFNSDRIIQATDYDKWSFLPAAVNVYEDTDVNLDGVIQSTDYDVWFNNNAKVGAVEVDF